MTSLNFLLMLWLTVRLDAPLIIEQIEICFSNLRNLHKGVSH